MWIAASIAIVIALLAVFYVAQPILQSRNQLLIDDNHPVADLLQRKDAALRAIKELEFDYKTGKLNAEDYERINQRLRQQATNFLRQIEIIVPDSGAADAELESVIAQKRRTSV